MPLVRRNKIVLRRGTSSQAITQTLALSDFTNEVQLSRLPLELWTMIFSHIEPNLRLPIMWALTLRFPSFAYIFTVPAKGLWMSWFFRGDDVAQQPVETRVSMNLWIGLAKDNRFLPITLHVLDTPRDTVNLVRLLPPESILHITAAHVTLTPSTFLCDFYSFLSIFESLQKLSITITHPSRSMAAWEPMPLTFMITNPEISNLTSLTALHLSGLWFQQRNLCGLQLPSITSLHLTNLPRSGENLPPVYNILFATPNLLHLSVHVLWSTQPTDSKIFDVKTGPEYDSWCPHLRSVSIAGQSELTGPFLTSLLRHPQSSIPIVNDVRFCRSWFTCDLDADPLSLIASRLADMDNLVVSIDHTALLIGSSRVSNGRAQLSWETEWRLCSVSASVRYSSTKDTRTKH